MRLFAVICALIILIQQPVQARTAPDSFADLSEKLIPAVVNISTTKEIKNNPLSQFRFEGLPEDHPFNEFEGFLDKFFSGPGGMAPGTRRANSLGSGFVIDPDGYIATNSHVIDGADEIIVTLNNDKEYKAEVIGQDPKTDLALLKIEARDKLPYVKFGNSDTSRVGDWVLVIGNPFGLGGTVTSGIISARARDINAGPFDDFIQTDAAINRGNSGGPMFNMDGEVIGINTAIYSPGGIGNIGIGFAVPSSMAKPIFNQLKETGSIERGWLGVRIQTVTDEIAESLGMKNPRGALVAEVLEDSPASSAGVKVGDVIIKFDGQEVEEMRRLPRIVAETPVNKRVEIEVLRGGDRKTLSTRIKRLDEESAEADYDQDTGHDEDEAEGEKLFGMELRPLKKSLKERFGLADKTAGLIVLDVEVNSNAYSRGIRRGDVLVEAADRKLETVEDLRTAIKTTQDKGRESLLLLIDRGGETLFLAVPFKQD